MVTLPASRRRLAALLTTLTSVLVLAGCSGLSGTGELEYVPGEGNVLQIAAADRSGVVDVSGSSLQGDAVDFADFRGEVVVVNVWWSQCGPCITEMPMLVEAEQELDADETEFLGINIRETSEENALAFERERGVDYPSIYDPGSETLLQFDGYPPSSMPSTAVLDREGRVAALISGAVPSKTTLTDVVEEVAAEDG